MCRIALAILCIAVIAVAATVSQSAVLARAEGAEELYTQASTDYVVNADGRIHVTITARVTSRDPSTVRRSSGTVYFYTGAPFIVHDAATNLIARSVGGTRLTVETRRRADLIRIVSVRFNRELYYNEAIDLAIEYDLTDVRSPDLLIRREYAFLPVIMQGEESILSVTALGDRTVTPVDAPNCGPNSILVGASGPWSTYYCGSSTNPTEYGMSGRCGSPPPILSQLPLARGTPSRPATQLLDTSSSRWRCPYTDSGVTGFLFEVQSKAPLAVREITVSLGRSEVKAVVHYFSGDEAWATHIEYLVHHGLPLLEKANGFPYAGPAAIDIVESGYRDTHGYAGSANKQGRIRLTPLVEDQIVLHELSHFWSEPFEPRWLREGMADYTANMVAVQLGAEPDRTPDTIPDAPRLADWQQPRYVSTRVPGLVLDAAGAAIPRDIERAGYIRSLRFVDLLAERAGAEGIARSNAHIADKKAKGDARGYLDALDDVTAKQHADLFAAWILTDADVKMLPARESARKSVALLRGRASPSGFTVPGEVADALARWEFSRALAYSETLSTALNKHRQTATQAHDAGFTLSNGFIHAFSASSESARRYADDEAAAFDAVRSAIAHGRGKHGLLTRVGLVGADLYPPESEAREALARGDHEQAMRSANLIARRIDRAEEDGRWRVGFAGGTILVLAVVATLLLRRRQSARPPRHTAQ